MILWWIESTREQHLFEIQIFCNIRNVFTVTFDQLNASSPLTFERLLRSYERAMTVSWKQKKPYRVENSWERRLNAAASVFQRFVRPEETHNNTSPARTPQQQSPDSVSLKTQAAGKWERLWQLSQWSAQLKRRKKGGTKRGEKVGFRAEKPVLEPKRRNGKCNGIKYGFGEGKVCQ